MPKTPETSAYRTHLSKVEELLEESTKQLSGGDHDLIGQLKKRIQHLEEKMESLTNERNRTKSRT